MDFDTDPSAEAESFVDVAMMLQRERLIQLIHCNSATSTQRRSSINADCQV